MSHNHIGHILYKQSEHEKPASFYKAMPMKVWISLAVIISITVLYLLMQHAAHLLDALLYSLLVGLLLMHGGHSGHGDKNNG